MVSRFAENVSKTTFEDPSILSTARPLKQKNPYVEEQNMVFDGLAYKRVEILPRPPGSKRHKAHALRLTRAATVGATIEVIQTQFYRIFRATSIKMTSVILGNNSEDRLKKFITSKHLLRIAQRSNMLFIDATYRIIDLDYPIIALVVLDTNVMFILINIAIVSDESAEIYLCVLKMLQEEIEKNGGIFNPTHIISDSDP
ncbi:hypothetical protein BB559_005112 [Furculomyces boomerangus]|uniref:MULE transposase domain-containing protein n=1 Tax=Furculomyces boomerangus TaxID=61424 RepID=A0A2T9YAQ3_9FUNG|nr:hypothetical protein BB559_005112 [Furculomyces boomerangus]